MENMKNLDRTVARYTVEPLAGVCCKHCWWHMELEAVQLILTAVHELELSLPSSIDLENRNILSVIRYTARIMEINR